MRAVIVDESGVRFDPNFDLRPKPGEVPVRVLVAGICETDLQIVGGYMGFQGVLGHEFVGIAEAGEFAGQRVVGEINCACQQCEMCAARLPNHCPNRTVVGIVNHDGAFADVVTLPECNLHAVPQSVTHQIAVFTEPLAAAFEISQQLDLSQHLTAAVIGDGRLAFLIAQVLRLEGCEVTVVGKYSDKLQKFRRMGFQTRLVTDEPSSRDYTLAVDCSGSITGIPTALRFLRPRGTLVLKTTTNDAHGPQLAPLVVDEINVIGSRCGPFEIALEALENQRIEVESLITAHYPIDRAIEALNVAGLPTHHKVLLEIA